MPRHNGDEVDKLQATYSFRMPIYTKTLVDCLSTYWKSKLNQELLVAVAKVLHDSEFDPGHYLKG